jgi:hypothetical protein
MIEGTFLFSNRSSDYAKPNLLETQFLVNGVTSAPRRGRLASYR